MLTLGKNWYWMRHDGFLPRPHAHTHIHTHTHIYIYRERKISPKFFRPKFFHGRPRGMSVPECFFFQDLEGLTEVFGRMSAGISAPKLPLWADFSFLNIHTHVHGLHGPFCLATRWHLGSYRARVSSFSLALISCINTRSNLHKCYTLTRNYCDKNSLISSRERLFQGIVHDICKFCKLFFQTNFAYVMLLCQRVHISSTCLAWKRDANRMDQPTSQRAPNLTYPNLQPLPHLCRLFLFRAHRKRIWGCEVVHICFGLWGVSCK